ncbi:hypothetical protein EDD17DRAFT_1591508 [Pisolithus thermaeus]|nr:hypothetical protein EDD17DRAFT_1591508 [Pisolithus thermaeus]
MSSSTARSHWKKPYNTSLKSAHSPVLTFALAEPKQASTLHSATTRLPNILRNSLSHKVPYETIPMKSGVSEAAGDVTEQPPVSQESAQSESVSRGPSPDLDVVAETTAGTGDIQDGDAEGISAPPEDPNPPPAAGPSPPSFSTSDRTLANKRSWFSAFTWARGQESEAKIDQAPEARSAPPACADSAELPPPPGSTVPSPSLAEATTTARAGDPNLKRSVSQSEDTSLSPPKLDLGNSSTDISKPPPSKAQSSPLATLQPAEASGSVVSPKSGMFTLGIPLLGRTKLPLDKVAAAARSEGVQSMPKTRDETPPQQAHATVATTPISSHPADVPATRIESETETSNAPKAPGDNDRVITNTGTSWWSYLAWNRGASGQHSQPSSDTAGTQHQPVHPVEDVDAPPPTSPATQLGTDCQPAPILKSESEDKDISLETTHQDTPTASGDGKESQGFTWYAPWSRYQAPSANVPSDGNAGVNSASQQLNGQKLEPTVEEPSVPSIESTDATGSLNPIQSSISQNRTGWMSFFSARAMAMKSITYEKEGEMEVMDIDEDASAAEGIGNPSLPSPAGTQDPSIKETRAPQLPSASSRGPSTTVEKTDVKQQQKVTTVTTSEANVREVVVRQSSPSPSKKSIVKTPVTPRPPNVVLPTWEHIFHVPPRSIIPEAPASTLAKALKSVTGALFARNESSAEQGKGKRREATCSPYERALPRAWNVLGDDSPDVLRGCQRVVVIGVHGWFPGAVARTFIGEPTGTSSKFVNRVVQALDEFQEKHNVKLTKITKIPLEGEGTINRRVDKLYQNLTSNEEWMNDLREADAIFLATHSQGSIVSTHILDRLIADRHIRTKANTTVFPGGIALPPQRICCLGLCGIHLGPLRYLNTNSLLSPYIQYFESTAARELFEFQNTESAISTDYIRALRNVLDNGIKMVYIASLNDQVVGLYSGLFTSVSHPLILRAIYIDGDAYHSSDFLSNLLALLLRIRNAGLSDSGLLTHLSEATAGSLNGIGHSTPYEELGTYTLAINYLFLANDGLEEPTELTTESFNALTEQNDYEIPWALRDLIADDRVTSLFSDELVGLRDAFRNWQPKTAIQRDLKRKLQPIQRLSASMISGGERSMSKL